MNFNGRFTKIVFFFNSLTEKLKRNNRNKFTESNKSFYE